MYGETTTVETEGVEGVRGMRARGGQIRESAVVNTSS